MQKHLDVYGSMPTAAFTALIAAHLRTTSATGLDVEAERAYLGRYAGPEGQRRYLDQVAGFTEDDTRDVVARLGEITVPTDVVWGAEDRWLPSTAATALHGHIPGARLHTVDGAGHFLTEDAPEAFLEVLAAVLP